MEITRIDSIESTAKSYKKSITTENYNKHEKEYNDDPQVKLKSNLKEVDSAVDKANKVLFKNNTHLQFRVHEKTNEVMVKIIDDETGEVLKEIPPEKMLDMVAKLWEIAGIFVDEKR